MARIISTSDHRVKVKFSKKLNRWEDRREIETALKVLERYGFIRGYEVTPELVAFWA